jgi:hypothetical protein
VTPTRLLTSGSGVLIIPNEISIRLMTPVDWSSTSHANVRASRLVHMDRMTIPKRSSDQPRGRIVSSHASGKPRSTAIAVTSVDTRKVLKRILR